MHWRRCWTKDIKNQPQLVVASRVLYQCLCAINLISHTLETTDSISSGLGWHDKCSLVTASSCLIPIAVVRLVSGFGFLRSVSKLASVRSVCRFIVCGFCYLWCLLLGASKSIICIYSESEYYPCLIVVLLLWYPECLLRDQVESSLIRPSDYWIFINHLQVNNLVTV